MALTLNRRPKELEGLITKSRTTLSSFAKAKTAKLGIGFHLQSSGLDFMLNIEI
jgi:hypothetical protein